MAQVKQIKLAVIFEMTNFTSTTQIHSIP